METPDLFYTTRWSVVRSAAGPDRERALASLFEGYWLPLYRYARRLGESREDAEDLVQGLFSELASGRQFEGLEAGKGRFRSYLLAALQRYRKGRYRYEMRQKRGGMAVHFSIDQAVAERGLELPGKEGESPDRLFDREWARRVLDCALEELGKGFEEAELSILRPFLELGREQMSFAEVAEKLGCSEGAARVRVHRLRKDYREKVREQIRGTLLQEGGVPVAEEMEALFAALRGE